MKRTFEDLMKDAEEAAEQAWRDWHAKRCSMMLGAAIAEGIPVWCDFSIDEIGNYATEVVVAAVDRLQAILIERGVKYPPL